MMPPLHVFEEAFVQVPPLPVTVNDPLLPRLWTKTPLEPPALVALTDWKVIEPVLLSPPTSITGPVVPVIVRAVTLMPVTAPYDTLKFVIARIPATFMSIPLTTTLDASVSV